MNKELLIELIQKSSKPLSFKEISDTFKLKSSQRKKLKKILKELIEQGKIIRNRKGLYLPIKEIKLITGFFEAHKEGYGFIIPDSPSESDIFIPPHATMGAMHNDRVVARIENLKRREGRIIRILERAIRRIIGKVEKSGPIYYVKPRKKFINQQIILHPVETDLKQGQLVLAEITKYQTPDKPVIAKIVKTFETPKTPKDEIKILFYEYNLSKKFPPSVNEAVKSYTKKVISTKQIKNRRDLRELITVTIDGENAKDFDDAVSIKKTQNGYILWVHIADVSSYVKWNSPLDLEARQRGTSIYLPDIVIPMLPPELSENLCSLIPKTPRLTFTVEIHFNNNGEKIESLFYPSLIQTVARMTYTSVKKILIDKDPEERKKYKSLIPYFETMAELCNLLKNRRIKRGSLDFDLPEPEVLLDIQGNPEAIIKAERNLAHFIIEEFMIAANESVAEFLNSNNIPSLYRVHEVPEPNKIQFLTKILRNLGILESKDIKPKEFPQFIDLIKGSQYEEIVSYLILRSLKQARYSPENVGHFGLASECYTHFTSPIRRYPDLVVHRILKEFLQKGSLTNKKIIEILPEIAIHSSRMERRADEIERDSIQIMRVWFMKDKIGEEYEGKVTMVTPEGLRVRLNEFYIEGFLHLSHMIDDFYQYDEKRYCLIGLKRKKRFTIGSPIKVRVSRVDIDEREIVFDLL